METIQIDRSQAETLIRFLDKCREAERFFEVCQGPSYRRFVSNALADPALDGAYKGLRESLSADRGGEKPEKKKPTAEKVVLPPRGKLSNSVSGRETVAIDSAESHKAKGE